jgi:hypothetical protein
MRETWNLHGDAFVFRWGASKEIYFQKTAKNDELTERVDPAKPAG